MSGLDLLVDPGTYSVNGTLQFLKKDCVVVI